MHAFTHAGAQHESYFCLSAEGDRRGLRVGAGVTYDQVSHPKFRHEMGEAQAQRVQT